MILEDNVFTVTLITSIYHTIFWRRQTIRQKRHKHP